MKSVVICGSVKNIKEMEEFAQELKALGAIVYSPAPAKFADEWNEISEEFKRYSAAGLTYDHFQKIKKSRCSIYPKQRWIRWL